MLIELVEIAIIKRFYEKKTVNDLIILLNGVLIGLLILAKQTTGMVMAVGLFFTPLLFIKNADTKVSSPCFDKHCLAKSIHSMYVFICMHASVHLFTHPHTSIDS